MINNFRFAKCFKISKHIPMYHFIQYSLSLSGALGLPEVDIFLEGNMKCIS